MTAVTETQKGLVSFYKGLLGQKISKSKTVNPDVIGAEPVLSSSECCRS